MKPATEQRICRKGHVIIGTSIYCTECKRVYNREQKREHREQMRMATKPRERVLPPPAQQPVNPYALSRAELARERKAAAKRREKILERVIGKPVEPTPFVVGKGHGRPKRRIVECACGAEFVATHGKQRLCLACKAARASGRKR